MTQDEYLVDTSMQAGMHELFTKSESAELQNLLQGVPLKKVVRHLQDFAAELATAIAGCAFITPEGAGEATKLQGKRDGILAAINLIMAAAFEPVETEEVEDGEEQ